MKSAANKVDPAKRARHAVCGVATSSNVELSALWLSESGRRFAIDRCREALQQSKGSIEKAAKLLGIGRRTLYRWVEQHPEIRRTA